MTIGLLPYTSTTMHARVAGFDGEDESPPGHQGETLLSAAEWDVLILRAYSQLFFHTFSADREPFLESQLRNGQINVRQFMRGLCLSERFRSWVYRCNNNYEVVEHLVQRLLGRDMNGEQEKLAWSIVIAQRGLAGLVDALLDSQEYVSTFGNNTVPLPAAPSALGPDVGVSTSQCQAAPLQQLLAGCDGRVCARQRTGTPAAHL